MLDKHSLKPIIEINTKTVECPAVGCTNRVELRTDRKSHLNSAPYHCARDHIYIAKSTFEYEDKFENLLWKDPADRALLDRIGVGKQDDRMARETSEDAITWNVFRYLETSGFLGPWLERISGVPVGKTSLTYWSYCDEPGVQKVWPMLAAARKQFRERTDHPSEPDLIADTDAGVFWIEGKLTAFNKTKPSPRPKVPPKVDIPPAVYDTGADGWYNKAIVTPFQELAVAKQRYEMLRYWLLGSWAAAQLNKAFYLVSLVRKEKSENMAEVLASDFRMEPNRRVLSTTWEDIYAFLKESPMRTEQTDRLLTYMENKTAGYKTVKNNAAGNGIHGELQPAFVL